MVYLSRIYTRTGDDGTTALGDGRRVAKDHPRVAAYGSVDELNAALGLVLAARPARAHADLLRSIQNDLFDLGADLCVPQRGDAAPARPGESAADQGSRGPGRAGAEVANERGGGAAGGAGAPALRVRAEQVARLERAIDSINARLKPLRSFVLPGGAPLAAWLHLARTICRRAEREVVGLARHEQVNPNARIYLNRLSDLLFVMARAASRGREPLWVPGGAGVARRGERKGRGGGRLPGSRARRR
jgi:cob(I)alamin adenosyltransferase